MPEADQTTFGTVTNGVIAEISRWLASQPVLASLIIAALIVLVAFVIRWALQRYLHGLLARIIALYGRGWDHALERRKVVSKVLNIVPLLVIRAALPLIPILPAGLGTVIQRLLAAGLVLLITQAIAGFVNAYGDVYARTPRARERPIKSYLQSGILVLYIVAAIVAVAVLADQNPMIIISGLGAASAILLLVFRDTILSLVAGVQLTSNDSIRVGDWIEMPQFGADGDVVEIALNNVKVQNWDKTFTIIPGHKFLETSFKNWRGMQESGGRRIKRNISIDLNTIRFLSQEEAESFERFRLLDDYIHEKEEELISWNRLYAGDGVHPVNARRLTNIGTFRAYVINYLRAHPGINNDLTFLVRQLAPGPEGMPLEIYVFTNDTRWAVYEGIQADIFDHLFAIMPEFGLRPFQAPSGVDFRALGEAQAQQDEAPAGPPRESAPPA